MGIPLMMGIVCKWYIPFFNQPLLGMVDHPSPKKNGLNGAVRHLPGCEWRQIKCSKPEKPLYHVYITLHNIDICEYGIFKPSVKQPANRQANCEFNRLLNGNGTLQSRRCLRLRRLHGLLIANQGSTILVANELTTWEGAPNYIINQALLIRGWQYWYCNCHGYWNFIWIRTVVYWICVYLHADMILPVLWWSSWVLMIVRVLSVSSLSF